MSIEHDNVVIRRTSSGNVKNTSKQNQSKSGIQKNNSKAATGQNHPFEQKNYKRIKTISIVMFLIAILILLSLISHSRADEANADISFFELISIPFSDSSEYTEQVQNWLGILGAYISNVLYNFTFGYIILLLPLYITLWAKHLFINLKVSNDIINKTLYYFLFAMFVSSFIATIRSLNWINELPKEWCGNIGMFVSNIMSKLTGKTGAFLIFFTGMIIAFIFLFDINIEKSSEKAKAIILMIKDWILTRLRSIASPLLKLISKVKNNNIPVIASTKIDDKESVDIEETFEDSQIEEPARIIRRNLNLDLIGKKNPFIEIGNLNKSIQVNNLNDDEINLNESGPYQYYEQNMTQQSDRNIQSNLDEIQNLKSELNTDGFTPNQLNKNEGTRKEIYESPKPDFYKYSIKSREELPTNLEMKIENIPQQQVNKSFIEKSEMENHEEDETEETILEEDYLESRIEDNVPQNKPLIVTVHNVKDELKEIFTPLGTLIHDEEITYQYPTTSLLSEEPDEINEVDDNELKENARLLQEKLETFKIYIENLSVTPGPVVTQYEFTPAAGIKISKIESLADDLAMALKARGIRIIAPIPGKGTIGIEIPNQNPSIVRFSSVIKSSKFHNTSFRLPIALGKIITGEVYCADLSKMPHLLIAGSTGSGKSVGINTIIASLLFKMHPKNLKFVIIDPKKVELRQYARLENHFIAASPDLDDVIFSNPKDAVIILKSLVAEMELRYDILSSVGQRNIFDYNRKVREGKLQDNDIAHRPMPYIVVIIDELADLMLTASKEVEEPITRLAQMARAVGIHIVLATQRPSVDIITGIIKANFPARIAYLVAQKVDSRTILDLSGAEQLLGNGDMLFLPNGSPKPIRIQNSFITTDEIEALCDFIGKQKGYSQPYMLPSLNEKKGSNGTGDDGFDRDPLFEEAARLVIRHQQGSVSLIQRRLKVGYARAGRIVDELEHAGVVGPYDGSKARQVLMTSEDELEFVI